MKRILQIAALTVAVAQPALAATDKVTLCHKGTDTLSIAQSAVRAHTNHGDTLGACPVVEPTPAAAALMRCDSVVGSMVVVAVSASDQGEVPVELPVAVDGNCAAGVADLLNSGWQLKFVTSGSAVTPGEGQSGFVTEYTFVTTQPQAPVTP